MEREFRQITVEEVLELLRGTYPENKLLLMIDDAENEEHKFGISGHDSLGNPITEKSKGLVINYALTTYFVSQADIKAYFETHDRPKRPMTVEQENVYLRAKIKELEAKQEEKKPKEAPTRAKRASEVKKEEPVAPPEAPVELPERDKGIPKAKPGKPEEFTTEDLKEVFAKEIHEDKPISEKAQKAALKKAEEKKEKRDRLT